MRCSAKVLSHGGSEEGEEDFTSGCEGDELIPASREVGVEEGVGEQTTRLPRENLVRAG